MAKPKYTIQNFLKEKIFGLPRWVWLAIPLLLIPLTVIRGQLPAERNISMSEVIKFLILFIGTFGYLWYLKVRSDN